MKRVVWIFVAACSSREQVVTTGSGSARVPVPAEAAVSHAQLPWKPLPVLVVFGRESLDPTRWTVVP